MSEYVSKFSRNEFSLKGLMEEVLRSRKNEARILLKRCFGKEIFSLVPLEVWRDLVLKNVDTRSITILYQTGWGFKELIDLYGEKNIILALKLRKEGQISVARKYLQKCADKNDSVAMFHLGYAHAVFGWGLMQDDEKSFEWFKKSAELGNTKAMALFSSLLKKRDQKELSKNYAMKVLSSKDALAIGYCHLHGLEIPNNLAEAARMFVQAAKEGCEFAQLEAGKLLSYSWNEAEKKQAFEYCKMSADQGQAIACCRIGCYYLEEDDKENAKLWFSKSFNQGHPMAVSDLMNE